MGEQRSQIEITEPMITAGLNAYASLAWHDHRSAGSPREIVTEVLREGLSARSVADINAANLPILPPMQPGDDIYVGPSEIDAYKATCAAADSPIEWKLITEGPWAGAWVGTMKEKKG